MKSETAQTVVIVVAIIGVGVALWTAMPDQEALRKDIFAGQEALRDQIDGLRDDMREDNRGVRKEVSDLRGDVANLDGRVGRLEGLLKGLSGHNQAARPAEIRETFESVAAASGSVREDTDGSDMEEFTGGATRPSGIPGTR